jgi:hypothetical protein
MLVVPLLIEAVYYTDQFSKYGNCVIWYIESIFECD